MIFVNIQLKELEMDYSYLFVKIMSQIKGEYLEISPCDMVFIYCISALRIILMKCGGKLGAHEINIGLPTRNGIC